MYDKINDVTFYKMTDRETFLYLMKKHYIETVWNMNQLQTPNGQT